MKSARDIVSENIGREEIIQSIGFRGNDNDYPEYFKQKYYEQSQVDERDKQLIELCEINHKAEFKDNLSKLREELKTKFDNIVSDMPHEDSPYADCTCMGCEYVRCLVEDFNIDSLFDKYLNGLEGISQVGGRELKLDDSLSNDKGSIPLESIHTESNYCCQCLGKGVVYQLSKPSLDAHWIELECDCKCHKNYTQDVSVQQAGEPVKVGIIGKNFSSSNEVSGGVQDNQETQGSDKNGLTKINSNPSLEIICKCGHERLYHADNPNKESCGIELCECEVFNPSREINSKFNVGDMVCIVNTKTGNDGDRGIIIGVNLKDNILVYTTQHFVNHEKAGYTLHTGKYLKLIKSHALEGNDAK